MTTAAATGITGAGGADLNTFFEGITGGGAAATGIRKGAADLNTIFEPIASGSAGSACGVRKGAADLNTIFAGIGTVSSITATPVGGTIDRTRTSGTCYAGVSFKTDSIEYWTGALGGATFTQNKGDWTDGTNGASSYWIERTINSGSIAGDTIGTGRVQLGSVDRYLRVAESGSPPTGQTYTTTANVTVNFYAASSGGSSIGSATYTLTANKDNPL